MGQKKHNIIYALVKKLLEILRLLTCFDAERERE